MADLSQWKRLLWKAVLDCVYSMRCNIGKILPRCIIKNVTFQLLWPSSDKLLDLWFLHVWSCSLRILYARNLGVASMNNVKGVMHVYCQHLMSDFKVYQCFLCQIFARHNFDTTILNFEKSLLLQTSTFWLPTWKFDCQSQNVTLYVKILYSVSKFSIGCQNWMSHVKIQYYVYIVLC